MSPWLPQCEQLKQLHLQAHVVMGWFTPAQQHSCFVHWQIHNIVLLLYSTTYRTIYIYNNNNNSNILYNNNIYYVIIIANMMLYYIYLW